MSCDEWKDRWMDELCGELGPDEARLLQSHLAECEPCRRELRELTEVRAILKDAEPVVPVAPRVVILAHPPRRAPMWAVAAGLAGLGLLAGMALSWSWQARVAAASVVRDLAAAQEKSGTVQATAMPAADEIDRRVREGIERYLAARVPAEDDPAGAERGANSLTAAELDARLARLDRKYGRERATDLQYVLDELAGVEARTSVRLGETQQAIRYVALANDPRVSEQ